jgi:membrane-bound lytic murein transglycosylase D
MMMKPIIVLIILMALIANHDTIAQNDSLIVSKSNEDYVPGDADFDLVKDRLSCIENQIPLHYNTKVHAFVNYFTIKDRAYTKMILQRKTAYFPLFEKYLAKYGLPDELKYLSIIESGLNPIASSRVQAVGLWQFMPATGRSFGLNNDWYVDDRMDPEKATEAACKYLKQLYGMFGDWELAIAAYNTGPGNIRKAIRRSGYKKTFWEIYPHLFQETRSYLPQFTAMIYTVNFANEHNFIEENLEYFPALDTIYVDHYVHIETLAAQLNLCTDDLKKLNPSLKRLVVPSETNGFSIKIPEDLKVTFTDNRLAILDSASKVGKNEIHLIAKKAEGNIYGREKVIYKVRSGDVLGSIAERYKVRVSDIRTWNKISGSTIRVGQNLAIYQRPGAIAKSITPVFEKLPDGTKTYIVQPGDTLWEISRKFDGLSIEKLKSLNELQSNTIKAGQKLIIGS